MFRLAWRSLAILLGAATALAAGPLHAQKPLHFQKRLYAQNAEQKPAEHGKAEAGKGETAKDAAGRSDEVAEAGQNMTGPAARGECVWLGERAVGLMWRDDLDTAFRHLDLYDRFGCPGGHVQAAFRCLTRFGAFDPKAPETLSQRVHACWINPAAQPPQQAAAASPPAPTPAATPAPAGSPQPAQQPAPQASPSPQPPAK